MSFRSKLVAFGAAAAVVGASFAFPGIASATPVATPAQPHVFATNINNTSSGSVPNQFATYNGVTYFAASTTEYGRAIFSVTASDHTPHLVAHVEDKDSNSRMLMSLTVYGHYLFFVDDATSNYGPVLPYIVDLNDNSLVSLSGLTGYSGVWATISGFAKVGDDVYFYTANDSTSWLNKFDITTGVASTVGTMPFMPRQDVSGRTPTGSTLAQFFAFGTNVYARTSDGTWNAYDTVSQTWSNTVKTAGGADISGVYLGNFQFNGSEVAILSNQDWGTNYTYITADGTSYSLGNAYSLRGATFAFNFNGDLYLFNEQDNSELDRVNTNGTVTNVTSTLFPGHSNMFMLNETNVDGYAVFAGGYDGTQLWKWDGTNSAQQIGTMSSPRGEEFYGSPTNYSVNANYRSITTVGDKIFMGYYFLASVGMEPYYFDLAGNATLAADLDQHRDGTDPEVCSSRINSGGSQYVLAETGVDGDKHLQKVLAKFDAVNSKLQYSTYELPAEYNWTCDFATIGNYAWFWTVYDSGTASINKLNLSTGEITQVQDIGVYENYFGRLNGFTDGSSYYFTLQNVLHKVDATTGEMSTLNATLNPYGSVLIGSTLYFTGSTGQNQSGYGNLESLDLSNPDAQPVILDLAQGQSFTQWAPSGLFNWNGKIAFYTPETDMNLPVAYAYAPATGTLQRLFQPVRDNNGGVDGFISVGSNLYMQVSDYPNSDRVYKWDGSSATELTFGFPVQCIGQAGSGLAISSTVYPDDYRKLYIADADGNVLSQIPDVADGYFCGSSFGDSTFLSVNKYKGQGGYGDEVGYVGNLAPVAVSRFGQPVTEAPSNPYGANGTEVDTTAPGVPTEVTASTGEGTIDVVWNAPTDGGTARDYEVISSPAGLTCSVVSNSAKCSGFPSDGITYTFTVRAKNAVGTSAASTSSNGAKSPIAASTPTIGGNVRLTQTVSAQTSGWSAGVSYTYQWLKDGVAISAATGSTYRIANGDLGHDISVRVTGSKAGLPSRTFTSRAQTVGTAVVTLYGTARIDNTLRVDPGIWPAGYTLSYQWRANTAPISGATGTTFKVTPNETLQRITVLITGTKAGARTITKVSPSTSQVPLGRLTLTPTPSVYGNAYVDGFLCSNTGSWDDNVDLSYQWYRNGHLIAGETSDCYYPTASDLSQRITLKVTGSKFGYVPVTKTSAGSMIDYYTFWGLWDPYVGGTAKVGETLTVDTGNYNWWDATASIQWLANGSPIRGATDTSFTLTSKQKNKTISVRMTVSAPYYRSAKLVSNSTDPVQP